MTRVRAVLVAGMVGAAAARGAMGQSPQARVGVSGGTATDLRGVKASAVSLTPSLAFRPDSNLTLLLGASGTRYANDEWAAGGSAALGFKIPLVAGLALAGAGRAGAIRTSYDVSLETLEAEPGMELAAGPLGIFGGALAATARTSLTLAPSPAGGLGLLPTPQPGRTDAVTRSAFGPVVGASLRLARFGPGEGVLLSYRLESARYQGARVTDHTLAARLARGPLTLAGSLLQRQAADERRATGGVQAAVAITPFLDLVAAAESYPSNRLTGAAGGRSLSGGLTLKLGGGLPRSALPRPAGIAPARPAMTRLVIRAEQAQRVEVAGDWSRWQPAPARRAPNGVWYADLAIPEGQYRYAFRIDGREWRVPEGAEAVDDGFGGKSAWLTVRGSGRQQVSSTNKEKQ